MIPESTVTAWSVGHPWPDADQVEQDLLLAQAICEIAKVGYDAHKAGRLVMERIVSLI